MKDMKEYEGEYIYGFQTDTDQGYMTNMMKWRDFDESRDDRKIV